MSDIKQQLATLHDQLASLREPDAETRQWLGILLADISRVLHAEPGASSPADSMENIAARFDVDHPALSNALRQLVGALGKAGI